MAVKAIGHVIGVLPQANGSVRFQLYASTPTASQQAIIMTEEINLNAGSLLINGAIRTEVQNYAATEWDVDFTPIVDTVQLIGGAS